MFSSTFSNLVTGVSEKTVNMACDLLEEILVKKQFLSFTDLICHGLGVVFATLWRLESINQSQESENNIDDCDSTVEREIHPMETVHRQTLRRIVDLLEKYLKMDLKSTFPSHDGKDLDTELKVFYLENKIK